MISWKNKMKIIWKILLLKRDSIDIEINELIEGYKVVDELKSWQPCDNHWGYKTGCKNEGIHCLSRTFLHIKVNLCNDDHVHVCESCSNELLDKTHDFR